MRRKKRHGAEDPDRRGKSVRAAEGGWLFSFFFRPSPSSSETISQPPLSWCLRLLAPVVCIHFTSTRRFVARAFCFTVFFALLDSCLSLSNFFIFFFLSFLLLLLLVLSHSPIFLYAPRTHCAQEIRPCGVSPDPNTDPTGAPSALFPFSPAPLVCVDDCSRGPLLESWMTFAYFHWMLHTAMPSQVLGA
ncbi:hypothetical protein BKA81DRAFT_163339 [Phyllosticta paracitricarpa]